MKLSFLRPVTVQNRSLNLFSFNCIQLARIVADTVATDVDTVNNYTKTKD